MKRPAALRLFATGLILVGIAAAIHGALRLTFGTRPLAIAARACSDLAFPIAVVLLWPDARRFPPLLLAWGAYAIGLGQALLLAESGARLHDGNFLWSPQLATFGVMAAPAAWLGRSSQRWNGRALAAWSVLLLHVAYGAWWINARLAAG